VVLFLAHDYPTKLSSTIVQSQISNKHLLSKSEYI